MLLSYMYSGQHPTTLPSSAGFNVGSSHGHGDPVNVETAFWAEPVGDPYGIAISRRRREFFRRLDSQNDRFLRQNHDVSHRWKRLSETHRMGVIIHTGQDKMSMAGVGVPAQGAP